MPKASAAKLERRALRVSVRFNYVLFPLDLRDFGQLLVARGYALSGDMPPDSPIGAPDVRHGGQGQLARKGEFVVDVNTERQFLGVAGGEPLQTLAELEGIADDLKDTVDFSKAMFYELQARYLVRPPTSPLSLVQAWGRDAAIVKTASAAFGRAMNLFSVRLISGPAGPNHPDYFEIWLQPAAASPDRDLGVSVVFRNAKLPEFRQLASSFEAMTAKLLQAT